jgi:hypothetical protein
MGLNESEGERSSGLCWLQFASKLQMECLRRRRKAMSLSAMLLPGKALETAELKPSRHSVLNPIVILLVLFILAGLVILIIYYHLVGTPSGFESFMDSQSMGVRFLMTTIGVLIKTYWTSLERGRVFPFPTFLSVPPI